MSKSNSECRLGCPQRFQYKITGPGANQQPGAQVLMQDRCQEEASVNGAQLV